MNIKDIFIFIIGAIGSFFSTLLGGWSAGLTTLVIFMAVDYMTGLVVAGVFKKSPKTETGALKSSTAFQGVIKKIFMLIIVLVATRVDLLLGCNYIRDLVIIAFVTNELISLTENAGLMGIPIPKVITKAIDVLKDKTESEDENNG